ncbi:MAG: AAA family ATPase [Terracidiphilus sp.]
MAGDSWDRFFVVTGGPGSGKSTVIEALGRLGVAIMPEAGRAIIRDQVAIGGNALPWADRMAFAELMLSWEMRSYRSALDVKGPVVFDRGIPDVVGYLELCNLPVPAHMRRAVDLFRYHRRVFIAPYWPEIFAQDSERKQSPEEAAATYRAMFDVYKAAGYELVHLPLAPVEERAEFILRTIGVLRASM